MKVKIGLGMGMSIVRHLCHAYILAIDSLAVYSTFEVPLFPPCSVNRKKDRSETFSLE